MALRINYNLASSSAQRGLSASQEAYAKQATLMSDLRIIFRTLGLLLKRI